MKPGKLALNDEDVPKGAARILNAAKIQEEWRRKRKLGLADDGNGGARKKRKVSVVDEAKKGKDVKPAMLIMPGESLTHFNR